ncbi:hypothetical protein CBL_04728 [Carabus blaptoides fortunei]
MAVTEPYPYYNFHARCIKSSSSLYNNHSPARYAPTLCKRDISLYSIRPYRSVFRYVSSESDGDREPQPYSGCKKKRSSDIDRSMIERRAGEMNIRMVRLLGMRLLTRLLLFVCFLSMASLLLLSRCGLGNLDNESADDQDTQTGAELHIICPHSHANQAIVHIRWSIVIGYMHNVSESLQEAAQAKASEFDSKSCAIEKMRQTIPAIRDISLPFPVTHRRIISNICKVSCCTGTFYPFERNKVVFSKL